MTDTHHRSTTSTVFFTFSRDRLGITVPSAFGASAAIRWAYTLPLWHASSCSNGAPRYYHASTPYTTGELIDKIRKMPIGRSLLYGFVGIVALGTVFSMWSDPLDPEIAASSADPGEWSTAKLKEYIQSHKLPLPGLDQSASNLTPAQQVNQRVLVLDDMSRRSLVRLVKQHRQQQGQEPQRVPSSSATERTPLVSSDASAEANERLMRASNLK